MSRYSWHLSWESCIFRCSKAGPNDRHSDVLGTCHQHCIKCWFDGAGVCHVKTDKSDTWAHISILNVLPTIQNLLWNTYDYWWCDSDKPFPEFFSKSTTPAINHQAKKDRSMNRLEGSLQLTAKFIFADPRMPSHLSLIPRPHQHCLCVKLAFAPPSCLPRMVVA